VNYDAKDLERSGGEANTMTGDISRPADQTPGVAVLRLRGEFDLDNCAALFSEITAALADVEVKRVVIDLAEVTFIDSATIGVLIDGHVDAVRSGRSLHIEHAHGGVLRVLQITGVADLLTAAASADGRTPSPPDPN
jgi:anti-anti-sigma factor